MPSSRVLCVLALAAAALAAWRSVPGGGVATARATILEKDLEADLWRLASPELEGRDSPSEGLARSAVWIEGRLRDAGWKPIEGESYRRPFARELPQPVAAECRLSLTVDGVDKPFALGADFVPITGCGGEARGEIVFLGFGIESRSERFDEIEGKDLAGKVALILEGEPRHPKRFDGPELTADATLWTKLAALRDNQLAGVLVVRRAPEPGAGAGKKKGAPELEPARLAFRHTWATWVGHDMTAVPQGLPPSLPPALEVSAACASELLGEDVEALATKIDRTCQPLARRPSGRSVSFAARVSTGRVSIDNVVALLEGSDEALKGQYVVIGAHYDHVGVDDRGRIGFGADDNGSGTAALLEVAQALAVEPQRRSLIVCAFAAEEDGLLGSKGFCENLPVPRESIVAMLNMDMIGRGDADEVVVLGLTQNPGLKTVLDRAAKLGRTGIKSLVTSGGEHLFARSDQYSFHQIGVPVLFFFEHLPETANRDYHTWRDTIDQLDFAKIANTARLVMQTAWVLANDDVRPPPPR